MKSRTLILMTSCISLCMPLLLLADGKQDDISRQTLIEAFEEAKNEAKALSTKLQELEQRISTPNKEENATALHKKFIQEVRDDSIPVHENQTTADSARTETLSKSKKLSETIQNDHRSGKKQQIATEFVQQEQIPVQQETAPTPTPIQQQRISKKLIKLQANNEQTVSPKSEVFDESSTLVVDSDMPLVIDEQPAEENAECCPVKVPCPITPQIACLCPSLRDGNGFYFTAEWLYWKFSEGGTEFAANFNPALPGDLQAAHSRKATFDWESGFRVGAGYQFPQNGWELYATYTQVLPSASNSTGVAFPLLAYQGPAQFSSVASANARWNIHFRTLDVEFAQKYCVTNSLNFRPHFGLKAGWIKQNFHVNYIDPMVGGTILGTSLTVQGKNDFKGVGLQAGLDSLWDLGCGFNIFGKLSGALLVSKFNLHQTQDQVLIATTTEEIDLKTNFYRVVPTAQLALGLAWEKGLSCDTMKLRFNIGFESQYWWNQNQLERFSSVSRPIYIRTAEDLGMYGLTLGGGFDF